MATGERTEQPTQRRRRRAREKGQVAKSVDLSRALGLLLIYLGWRVAGHSIADNLLRLVRAGFTSPVGGLGNPPSLSPVGGLGNPPSLSAVGGLGNPPSLSVEQVMAGYHQLLPLIAVILGPIMLAAVLGVLLPGLAQTRLLFSPATLQLDWNRINPASGFKRLISWRGVVATLKGIIQVAVVLGVCTWVLRARADVIVGMGAMPLGPMTAALLAVAAEMMAKSCLVLVVLGAADYAYEWYEHEKSLRMSRHELRREMREEEGDPQIRARRRQLRRGLLEQGISAEMPRADVVVTNPTHVAVALRYDPDEMPAPKVVAKGQRAIARRIIALAQTYGTPVIHNPPIARSLFEQAAIGSFIPETLYRVAAEIFAVVYGRRRERLLRRRRLLEASPAQGGEEGAP